VQRHGQGQEIGFALGTVQGRQMTRELRIVSQSIVLLDSGESYQVLQISDADGKQVFVNGTGNPRHFLDLWPGARELSGGDAAERFLGSTYREAIELLELKEITTREEWCPIQREAFQRWLNQSSIDQTIVSRYDLATKNNRYDLARG
jgi:hypothetical protein